MGVQHRHNWLTHASVTGSVAAGALVLAGCGGGSAGGVAPTPAPPVAAAPTPLPPPTPVPAPTPAPVPTSTLNFNTAEARRTDSLTFHGAIAAYDRNATGQGVTIGVIDNGIDADSPEFSGRIHAQSFDATGNARSIKGEGSHGTHVAQIAGGAKNDVGTFGIAFGATLLVLRADRPGSCSGTSVDAATDGCRYPETAMIAGIDRAIAVGARVVNISLGGNTAPGTALREAVARATAAGIIIVMSAGNSGNSIEDGTDPNNPQAFARGMRDAGGGLVIIVGSVGDARAISGFSNRAGTYADSYLTALGDAVCCIYENGVLKTEARAEGNFLFLLNGTSFAAPQVAGAIALVAQAFPALTPQQIVALLYQSARDAGAAGTDPTFGRGILDIGRAFAPIGVTSLAGTMTAVPLGAPLGSLSAAMGDVRASASGIVTDGFGRAFAVNLGAGLEVRAPQLRLLPALAEAGFGRVAARGATALSLRFGPVAGGWAQHDPHGWMATGQARALAASMVTRIGARDRVGFAAQRGLSGLIAGERGLSDQGMLIAARAGDALSPLLVPRLAALWRHDAGRWGKFSLLAEQGRIGGREADAAARAADRGGRDSRGMRIDRYARIGIGWDRRFGPLGVAVTANRTREAASVLGARLGPLFGAGGATSFDAALGATLALPGDWSLAGEWTGLALRPDRSGLVAGGRLSAAAVSVDLARAGLFATGDRLALRYAEPLRVTGGGVVLGLPTAHDPSSGATQFGTRTLALAPQGRERAVELGYRLPLGSGRLSVNSWWRKEPGHFAALDDDIGGAVRFVMGY